jgi:hypothetical protein
LIGIGCIDPDGELCSDPIDFERFVALGSVSCRHTGSKDAAEIYWSPKPLFEVAFSSITVGLPAAL